MDLINLSKELMRKQTQKNKAPAWLLTEISTRKGQELAKKHHVDERLVVSSLYLAHIVFSPVWNSQVQKSHMFSSAKLAAKYLDRWGVSKQEKAIILNSVEAHHANVSAKSKVAEVVKNAECFKFVTIEGSLIWLHELGLRGIPFEKAVPKVLAKMEQKRKLLTLSDCRSEAESKSGE